MEFKVWLEALDVSFDIGFDNIKSAIRSSFKQFEIRPPGATGNFIRIYASGRQIDINIYDTMFKGRKIPIVGIDFIWKDNVDWSSSDRSSADSLQKGTIALKNAMVQFLGQIVDLNVGVQYEPISGGKDKDRRAKLYEMVLRQLGFVYSPAEDLWVSRSLNDLRPQLTPAELLRLRTSNRT